jgi:glycosyltransferase involved in cell wall biosynthesis
MKKRVRVLAVINSRVQKLGSFEDYIVEFARKAKALDWSLGLVFPAIEAVDFIGRIDQEQAEIHVVAAPWTSRQGIFQLIQIIRRFKPEIINFHFCGTMHYFPVFLYCRLTGVAVAFHYHGEIRPLETLRWKSIHLSALRALSRCWSRVITVSEANKRFLQALNISTPIDVVYNGIDLNRFLQSSADLGSGISEKADGNALNCLYIGSLIRRKRVDVLLRAFAIVKEKCPSARLTIVGGGSLDGSLKALATELHLNDVVRFTGLMVCYPFDELSRSDIFVSASESESFGLVFAEAMSFGLPVIACRVGGIPEVVANGETGLLVEADNPTALATALLTLLEDHPLRTQMGEAGRQRVKQKFQLQETIDATYVSFAQLLI